MFLLKPVDRIDLSKVLRRSIKRTVHQNAGTFEEKLKLFICDEDNDAFRNVSIVMPNVIGEKITFSVQSRFITPKNREQEEPGLPFVAVNRDHFLNNFKKTARFSQNKTFFTHELPELLLP